MIKSLNQRSDSQMHNVDWNQFKVEGSFTAYT